ncbi:MAG: CoA transferase [Candidatus Tectomicrobia bacterium]|jgi:crotonobetainyl-CoA:carnitine CoA-transferase CaiB-like acyl-CoA transferase|nr:CoA transferase [Candidatus Tectomicrobia bacterium]HEX2277417.1 CaiB/BaiF CoA-transferase family protein [Candidatus Tectomicrobia bacterium]
MTMPLEGITVLDLTRLAPGPYCTMILADLGADVIKIEEPGPPTGRRAEQAGGLSPVPPPRDGVDRHAPHWALNRNKKTIGLNLKHDQARQIFYRLAEQADVVVEEFRPGVAKRLGIDYDTLRPRNPRLIYCAVTGYGQSGPYRDLVGHDINYISMAGCLGMIGARGGPPVIPHNIIADFAGGGMHGAIGVLAALMARERTGRGQFVDIAMADGVYSMLVSQLSTYFATGVVPRRGETPLDGGAHYYNVYETKDGKWLSIGSIEPWFYANLCKAIGREDLLPCEFVEGEQRDEIKDSLRATFKTRTRDEWFEILTRHDICVGKVYDLDETAQDPHLQARQMIVEVDHPGAGKVKQVGISVKLSETPGQIRFLAAPMGTHTEPVLTGLGYSREQIAELRAAGAIK